MIHDALPDSLQALRVADTSSLIRLHHRFEDALREPLPQAERVRTEKTLRRLAGELHHRGVLTAWRRVGAGEISGLPQMYVLSDGPFVRTPPGRGEALCLHLAAHGVKAWVVQHDEGPFDRVDVGGPLDPVLVQAVLDSWRM